MGKPFQRKQFFLHLQPQNGELAEWSKAHAWKVCNPQKGF